jgi:hypothetical protein
LKKIIINVTKAEIYMQHCRHIFSLTLSARLSRAHPLLRRKG